MDMLHTKMSSSHTNFFSSSFFGSNPKALKATFSSFAWRHLAAGVGKLSLGDGCATRPQKDEGALAMILPFVGWRIMFKNVI